MNRVAEVEKEIRHGHLFCGIGGGAIGFNRGQARVGHVRAKFVCVGGIDVDPASCRDFGRNVGVPATCMDLFTVEQFMAYHGKMPPAGWREAVPADIHAAFGHRRPHIAFLSAPCKGFSGLLSETASLNDKYQALNGLTLRGVWLLLEAYKDDPVEMIVFENVPRIATRGRSLLDRIIALLEAYGYVAAETTHDCGELGNLAQSRKRFLLVARHRDKVPPFLYEPEKHRLRGVGEVLDQLPMPLSGLGGPMHRMPSLQWKTWVRLAFVRAGGDWRTLNELEVADGVLRDYGIVPVANYHNGAYGVKRWDDHAGAVTSNGRPAAGSFAVADPRPGDLASAGRPNYGVNAWNDHGATVTSARSPGQGRGAVADPRPPNGGHGGKYKITKYDAPAGTIISGSTTGVGAFAVADVRIEQSGEYKQLGVIEWEKPKGTVTGQCQVGGGAHAVADPRMQGKKRFNSTYRIVRYDAPAPAVAGPGGPANGLAVADPRPTHGPNAHTTKHSVIGWKGPSKAVTGTDRIGSGALSVADPRPTFTRDGRMQYQSAGHYGVIAYGDPSLAVTGSGQHDNGYNSVADPRTESGSTGFPESSPEVNQLPEPADRLVCVIAALDDTWHRPFTTLELAALQGLVNPEEQFELDGLSDASWRERIGNCVPPPSAQAIAGVMGETLLLAWAGETFMLSAAPIWVRPIAVALSVKPQELPQ